jgi:hypothetical protein
MLRKRMIFLDLALEALKLAIHKKLVEKVLQGLDTEK